MKVKCVLCDRIDDINDDSPLAKRLRNRPIHTYMCPTCQEKIAVKTNQRKKTGKFIFYKQSDYEGI